MKQRTVLMVGVAIMGIGAMLMASSIPAEALSLAWDRNAEADLDHDNVYVCAPAPCTVTVGGSSTRSANIPQTTIGVIPSFVLPANTEGNATVTATDTSGNESPMSSVRFFDQRAPTVPANPRLVP